MSQMCWMPQFVGGSGKNVLHLNINDRWVPYTSCPQYAVADHKVPGGSLGWATYQSLRQQGWEIVPAPTQGESIGAIDRQ